MTALSQEQLASLLSYDPATGQFVWLISRKGLRAGSVAGSARPDGYVRINIAGRFYYAHRLAWLYQTGVWPPHLIDHINGNPADNRWQNLRLATHSENLRNKAATKGLKGASQDRRTGRWRATIQVNGRQRHLGVFDTADEAHAAYATAARTLHGDFARAA